MAWESRTFQGTTGYWARFTFSGGIFRQQGASIWLSGFGTASYRSAASSGGSNVRITDALVMRTDETGSVIHRVNNFGSILLDHSSGRFGTDTTNSLFMCFASPIDTFRVLDLSRSGWNTVTSTMSVDFWDTQWEDVESLVDGTSRSNRSLNRDGNITFAVPSLDPPSFGGATISNRSFIAGSPITAFALPAATSDADLTYSVSQLPASLTFNANTRQIAGTPTTSGSTTIVYTARDTEGQTATLQFAIIIIQDLMPGFGTSVVPNQTYEQNQRITALQLPAASGGNAPLAYSVTALPAGLQFSASNRQITGTPTTVGSTIVTYTVRDTDGDTANLSFTIRVNPPQPVNTAPTVDITTPNQQLAAGQEIAIQSNVMGNPTPMVQWSADLGTVTNRGVYTAPTATNEQQTATVTLTATNSAGSDSDTVTFTIPAIEVTSVSFGGATVGMRRFFAGRQIDAIQLPTAFGGEAEITYTVVGLPSGLVYDEMLRQISGETDAVGQYMIVYTATDGMTRDVIRFNIVIVQFTQKLRRTRDIIEIDWDDDGFNHPDSDVTDNFLEFYARYGIDVSVGDDLPFTTATGDLLLFNEDDKYDSERSTAISQVGLRRPHKVRVRTTRDGVA